MRVHFLHVEGHGDTVCAALVTLGAQIGRRVGSVALRTVHGWLEVVGSTSQRLCWANSSARATCVRQVG